MHLSNVDKSTSYVPEQLMAAGMAIVMVIMVMVAAPAITRKTKLIMCETNIYSLQSNKLLWSGTTSSLNPSKLDQTIDDIINTLKAQMQKQGLIK
jgi:hypothetical protein